MTGKVLLAEKHRAMRNALRELINSYPDYAVCAEADGEASLQQLAAQFRPDVIVADLGPGLEGLEMSTQVAREHPGTGVVVLSPYAIWEYALAALRAGANAYVVMEDVWTELPGALRSASEGTGFVSPNVRKPN